MMDSQPTFPDDENETTGDTGCEGLVPEPDLASARHCDIKIDGLPGQLPAGTYAMTFAGMEYRLGASRPTLRFRFGGPAQYPAPPVEQIPVRVDADDPHPEPPDWPGKPDGTPHDLKSVYEGNQRWEAEEALAEHQRQNPVKTAEQAEAEGWLPPRPVFVRHPNVVYSTRDGKLVTDAMIEGWVAEAEAGYDPDELRASAARTTDILQGAAYRSAQRLSRDIEREDLRRRLQEGEITPTEAQAELVRTIARERDENPMIISHSHSHAHPAEADTPLRVHTHRHTHPASNDGNHDHAHGLLPDQAEGWLSPGTPVVPFGPEGVLPPPSPPELPDYGHGGIELVNLGKLARVIAHLVRTSTVPAHSVGLVLDNDESWNSQIERWLRS